MEWIDKVLILSTHVYAWYKLYTEMKKKNENDKDNTI